MSGLVDYSSSESSDDDDVDHLINSDAAVSAPACPPSNVKVRSVPHIEGNWSTLVCVQGKQAMGGGEEGVDKHSELISNPLSAPIPHTTRQCPV